MNLSAVSLTKYVLDVLSEDDSFSTRLSVTDRAQTLKVAIECRFSNVVTRETEGLIHIQYLGPAFEQNSRRRCLE
jgi:hypothetical protein